MRNKISKLESLTAFRNLKISLLVLVFMSVQFMCIDLSSQQYVNQTTIVASQLGYKPDSYKTVTLVPSKDQSKLSDEIDFYVYTIGSRKKRELQMPIGWSGKTYNSPYDLGKGKFVDGNINKAPVYVGKLKKTQTRWGTFWQGDFTALDKEGIYQIECETGFTTPFTISKNPYDKFFRGFLNYLYCQRSGMEIPGIRPLENVDDGVLDTDGSFVAAAGGWNDAGDFRKWITQTSCIVEGLSLIVKYAHPSFKTTAIEEIKWGNKFFHAMINGEGRVYEDLGTGEIKGGEKYEDSWWCENHSGCIALGTSKTDNILMNGDERKIRTNFNPLCQFLFIRNQAIASTVLEPVDAAKCFTLAQNAWIYGEKVGHDQRTLFLSEELLAGVELYAAGSKMIKKERLIELADLLIKRQEINNPELNGYYYEKDQKDAYRSIAFNAEPAYALLRFYELGLSDVKNETNLAKESVVKYIENYLLKDALSNPFNVTPYGVFIKPLHTNSVTFRNAGKDRYVRTFINPLNEQEMIHGTHSVLMQHAFLMARAAIAMNNKNYAKNAEKLIQWGTGHNTVGLSLFTGIGFKHPVIASFVNYRIPDATVIGFIGRFDDTPYMESSNAIEWNTQEIWGVPYYNAIGAAIYLGMDTK
jgi:Glycosyl hydrolase family 9